LIQVAVYISSVPGTNLISLHLQTFYEITYNFLKK